MATQINLPWEKILRDTHTLANHVAVAGCFRGIVAVTRGGLMPAALLASELDIRLVDTMCVATYSGQQAGKPRTLKAPLAAMQTAGANWLVVDDLSDTGVTLRAVREILPKAYFVTLYTKPSGMNAVDHFVSRFAQDTWLNFPWEV